MAFHSFTMMLKKKMCIRDRVKAYLQQPINELHTMFRADVAAHMPVDASAPETWGDGQVFLASRAHELGLVTGIVPGMDALIALINTTKEKPCLLYTSRMCIRDRHTSFL